MAEYGITKEGINIKRADVILDEMQTELSSRWNVNVKENPRSFLNVFLADVADKIAELWEFGQGMYYAQFPSTAEGSALDMAVQYGGVMRKRAKKSKYDIYCTGIDGTNLDATTTIESVTNPPVRLRIASESRIARESAHLLRVSFVGDVSRANEYSVGAGSEYGEGIASVIIPNVGESKLSVVQRFVGLINQRGDIRAYIDEGDESGDFAVECISQTDNLYFTLGNGFTTKYVTSVIRFETEEYGDIKLPIGSITSIVRANIGLSSVTNPLAYIAGSEEETDDELRMNYTLRMFARSSGMIESIRSAILSNVDGVTMVSGTENDTDETDVNGLPPHSFRMIVSGGNEQEIAREIFNTKAAGIRAYGDTVVPVTTEYGDTVNIGFTRPTNQYIWFKATSSSSNIMNYASTIKEKILKYMSGKKAGDVINVNRFISDILNSCNDPSVDDMQIKMAYTTDPSSVPVSQQYTNTTISLSDTQNPVTGEQRIIIAVTN